MRALAAPSDDALLDVVPDAGLLAVGEHRAHLDASRAECLGFLQLARHRLATREPKWQPDFAHDREIGSVALTVVRARTEPFLARRRVVAAGYVTLDDEAVDPTARLLVQG